MIRHYSGVIFLALSSWEVRGGISLCDILATGPLIISDTCLASSIVVSGVAICKNSCSAWFIDTSDFYTVVWAVDEIQHYLT